MKVVLHLKSGRTLTLHQKLVPLYTLDRVIGDDLSDYRYERYFMTFQIGDGKEEPLQFGPRTTTFTDGDGEINKQLNRINSIFDIKFLLAEAIKKIVARTPYLHQETYELYSSKLKEIEIKKHKVDKVYADNAELDDDGNYIFDVAVNLAEKHSRIVFEKAEEAIRLKLEEQKAERSRRKAEAKAKQAAEISKQKTKAERKPPSRSTGAHRERQTSLKFKFDGSKLVPIDEATKREIERTRDSHTGRPPL